MMATMKITARETRKFNILSILSSTNIHENLLFSILFAEDGISSSQNILGYDVSDSSIV